MPTAMIMRGTTMGDSTKASMADLPRMSARTSRKAAGVPISMASRPVPTPTTSERVMACIHTGDVNICSYHCSEKPLGGQVRPEPESNDSGIIRKAGADRKASTASTIHHRVRDWPVPDTERRSWFLGDWAVPEGVDKGGESVLHVNSCFLSECLADMVQMANLLGRTTDAERFDSWRQRLNASIHRHFYHSESHTYANGTPLDQCYALLLGIPPDSATAAAVKEQLLKDCHGKYRDHIAAGLMGVPIFTEWCIRERQTDLMATILRQPDYPGYLNMINQGATTTWESWDCGRPGKEDRSRVHNCYNGIGIWFYQALAGIRPDPEHPGHKHFFIDPQPCKDVDWVKCTKPTPYGTIKVEIVNGELAVEVPENTTATVFPGSPRERTVAAGKWVIPIK